MTRPQERLHLLLVEDDEEDYLIFQEMTADIRTPDIRLTWVTSAEQALSRLSEKDFHLIFVDYLLGKTTGLELLQQIQDQGHPQPIILLTGQGDLDIDLAAMAKGVADYLEKDHLSPPLLERVIRYARARAETLQALQKSERQLRHLSQRLFQTQEEERARLARELHDSTSANLTAIKYALEKKFYETDQDPDHPDTHYFKHLINLVQETTGEIQRIYSDLRPTILDELGVLAALRQNCRRFLALYEDIEIKWNLEIEEARIPEPLKIAIFRIAQEALHNIGKHSQADQVQLSLSPAKEQDIRLEITDNGCGFNAASSLNDEIENRSSGFGLMNMKERAAFSGGEFNIEAAPGRGTRLEITWPSSLFSDLDLVQGQRP